MKEIDPMDLIDRFEESTLTELVYEKDNMKLVLKREVKTVTAAPFPAAPGTNHPGSAQEAPAATVDPCLNSQIKAPIVGTFYRSPSPDSPAFVEPGSKVKKGDTVCILEAMKSMNELEAEFDCEIVKILVENGDMVEFDAPLFEVLPL